MPPLPDPNRRRRNVPTIPTTNLPRSGRPGPVPRPPKGYDFGDVGKAWWRWAWRLPQACGWSPGDLYLVARRARLEDDIAARATVDRLDLVELLDVDSDLIEVAEAVERAVRALAANASGKNLIEREMRELDDRLGLTPKGLAQLRWKIIDDVPDDDTGGAPVAVADIDERRRRLISAS